MGFITGPKELLATSITNALDEYFVVDTSTIESTLLGPEKKIVLKQVQVRPKTISPLVAKNAGGTSTILDITGTVELVEFSWEWSTSGGTFVQNAKLTIQGMNITGELSKGEVEPEPQPGDGNTTSILPNESEIQDRDTLEHVKSEGGIKGYIMRQVAIMIDSLTLHIKDLQWTLKTPNNDGGTTSVVVKGESIEVNSFGRETDEITKELNAHIRQTLKVTGLQFNIVDDHDESKQTTTIPLLEPFSYQAQMIRHGKRFGNPLRGLTITGESFGSNGVVLHAGHAQLYAWSQFSLMLLAAKDESAAAASQQTKEEHHDHVEVGLEDILPIKAEDLSERPSEFNLAAQAMALIIADGMQFNFTRVGATYKADGSNSALKAEQFTWIEQQEQRHQQGEEGQEMVQLAHVQGIFISQTPNLVVEMEKIVSLKVPGTVQLVSPSERARVEFEGRTMKVKLETFECQFLEKENGDAEPGTSQQEEEKQPDPKDRVNTQAPFPIQVAVNRLGVQSSDAGSRSQFKGLEMFLNPSEEGTEFAAVVEELDNKLVHCTENLVCGCWPKTGSNEIHNLKLASDTITVYGGHSTNEWIDTFQLTGDKEQTKALFEKNNKSDGKDHQKAKEEAENNLWILPHCRVEELKVHITYEGAVGVRDVNFKTDPFIGKDKATGKDIANHYIVLCLKNFPGFITNSEVLGLSVVDMGLNTYGTYLGLATPFGAAGGLAAIAAVDTVKGAVAAGKKARNADQEDKAQLTDVVRGIGYAAVDATKRGALRRGKKDSENLNVVDWVEGVTHDTTKYVDDNKARLGGAGGAGAGMLVGTLLGGPVGGIIGGILGGATTQKTIETLEKQVSK
ncbi:expressed unknown protein [Seminavis robusta]|uniref:Uncharacterized protein n=1 Tax=Seminavis robusta TaxID=568900 RepID=A0A9N8DNF0_9STRA|nr:expressed unknown protein [Seminavis robusta]|eukprot:Sro176_g077460.1 n/a (849) ;mRNA; r:66277-68823